MAETAHTEEHGGGQAAFPPFQSETFASQLLWLAIAFVALYALMSKVALPRVTTIIDTRQKRIADDLAAAQRLKNDSDTALAAYEKSLADARGRAQTIANETRDKLNAESETSRRKLEESLNARLAEAEKTIATTKQKAMTNVRGIAVDAASAIVERLIGSTPPAATVEAAVDGALKS